MNWVVVAVVAAVISGVIAFGLMKRFVRRQKILSIAIPFGVLIVLFLLSFEIGEAQAVCSAPGPECGPLIFVAAGTFAVAISISGFLGALTGVTLARRSARR